MSGYDILNVAAALTAPRWLSKRLENSPIGAIYADSDLLKKHTNRFDKLLANVFYILLIGSFSCMVVLAFLDELGFFSD